MVELEGNIWDFLPNVADRNLRYFYLGITINGNVKKNGELVMGRGIAAQAKQRYPKLARVFGQYHRVHGLRVNFQQVFDRGVYRFFFGFPTKIDWWKPASLELIEQSCRELQSTMRGNPNLVCYMTRPGCGNGGLKWDVVKPLMNKYFANLNLTIVNNPKRVVRGAE